jgi:AAA+ ATPase superfamily predicted ATPase
MERPMDIVGRSAELKTIHHALMSDKPELVAVWGRRRVGKTFLIRYGRTPVADWYFELTGQRNGKQRVQLEHFAKALSHSFHNDIALRPPSTWELAFGELEKSIESLPADSKPVTVFFDEAPWLDSRRSGFLDALEYFWNSRGTRISRLKMFVCGSAASWIVHKIVQGKGGWHRRVTDLIRLPQFKLHSVSTYLAHQHVRLSRLDIVKLYMVLGGVPYYLAFMRRGESISAFVNRLLFSSDAPLQGEFDELFDSLFNNSASHKQIITQVAKTKDGLTRAQISAQAKLASGGKLTQYLDNLEESGFLEVHEPLGARGERYWRYRPCDMFTLFHLQWLSGGRRMRSWHAIASSQQYKSWCGHAFEIVVWNHAHSIASTLGIAKSDYTVTRADLENSAGKAQIDLLFDVRGGAVYLFELKFCDGAFTMTRAEAEKLQLRKQVLDAHFKGRRSIIVCLLAPEGMRGNEHSKAAVDLILNADALFRDGES